MSMEEAEEGGSRADWVRPAPDRSGIFVSTAQPCWHGRGVAEGMPSICWFGLPWTKTRAGPGRLDK